MSFIFPALDEESGDHSTITCIPLNEIRVTFGYDVEIPVIDGNSTDMTREVAQKAGVQAI
jgi:hypothetical protein